MSLALPFTVGRFRCHTLEAGLQRLDGGAMFGVVPKPLWERAIRPDERNRIPLAMRCLLIEHPDGLVLVDTGAGDKDDAKFRDIYGIENAGRQGATQLEDALLEAGHRPEDVRWVINTHLHFDHAGGNTLRGAGDEPAEPEPVGQPAGAPRVPERHLHRAARRARVRPPHQRAHPGELPARQLRADRRPAPLEAAQRRRAGAAGDLGAGHARPRAVAPDGDDLRRRRARPASWAT